MKRFLFTRLFLGSTTILSLLLFINPASIASPSQIANKQSNKPSVQYRCIDRQGTPATVAYTTRGPIELIAWKNNYFSGSGYTPERRCREVTSRFQQHSDTENLRYISTGTLNNYKVICVSEKSGNCKSNGLLITLQHNDNPEKVLRDLFNLAARKNSGPIDRTNSRRRPLKEMVDLDKFLEESPVINSLSRNSTAPSSNSEKVAPNPSVTDENRTIPSEENTSDNNKLVIENPYENF